MKYILIPLLITLNALAGFKVEIINSEGQEMSQPGFETTQKAQEYIDKFKSKWGRDAGWYKEECTGQTGTREVENDVGQTVTEYNCPATYTAEIKDTSIDDFNKKVQDAIKQSIDCGNKVIAHIGGMNISSGFTKEEIKQVFQIKPNLMSYLSGGSIDNARDEIASIDPAQEPLIDQMYKDSVLAKIDSCKFDWTTL